MYYPPVSVRSSFAPTVLANSIINSSPINRTSPIRTQQGSYIREASGYYIPGVAIVPQNQASPQLGQTVNGSPQKSKQQISTPQKAQSIVYQTTPKQPTTKQQGSSQRLKSQQTPDKPNIQPDELDFLKGISPDDQKTFYSLYKENENLKNRLKDLNRQEQDLLSIEDNLQEIFAKFKLKQKELVDQKNNGK